ncbi:cytochrome c oxidase subunit 7C, mitochondrial-like [Talpa occidentalis]|uniref:cytochrome c oxidase subunit 7C, mitochondrial-like n=1 Tax=Talpa occidentalis TaxID=50954 RepID=UPI00188E1B6D|nr:cytochrome c oxidase subunit 7C, mitochondrial-like [Talpa occidentalis]
MSEQSIQRFSTSVAQRSHCEDPEENLPFSVKNKWPLLIMIYVYLGSGFVAPFCIVRHQLFKKLKCFSYLDMKKSILSTVSLKNQTLELSPLE